MTYISGLKVNEIFNLIYLTKINFFVKNYYFKKNIFLLPLGMARVISSLL